MEDLTGWQFGPYRIVAPLGEGGMAAVFRAYQPNMDRYVALKVLPRYFASEPQFVSRFEQEARVLAKLQHPHILPVFDYGESEGYTYIVMTYVEAGSLSELLKEQSLTLGEIGRVISQVGDALDYAHSQGVLHRDVKPSNILVDSRGNCLLTDFGIAKMVESSSKLTQTGGILGTPAYMSPEQIASATLDGRTDIYSFGIVLYEMCTGRPPYQAETSAAVLVKHLHDPLPMPRRFNPALPEPVERVILRALAKKPEHRFPTAGEMVTAMEQALASLDPGLGDTVMRGQEELEPLPGTEAYVPVPPARPEPVPQEAPVPTAEPFVPVREEEPKQPLHEERLIPAQASVAPLKEHRRRLPWWGFGLIGLVLVAVVIAALALANPGRGGDSDLAAVPPEAVETEEAPAMVVEPTETPEPTATLMSSPTTQPPTEPPPTEFSPQATSTPVPTPTPRATPTALPTNTPPPTPTRMPTNTPPPSPTPTLEPQYVSLSRRCGDTYTVEAGRPIQLSYGGWSALGVELAEQNADRLRIDLLMNGQPITGYRLPAVPVSQLPCPPEETFEGFYGVQRTTTLAGLAPGTYEMAVTYIATEQITDGYDADGDGQGDLYGPGEIASFVFTLIAQ
jgi:serine/threonine-protein kinase